MRRALVLFETTLLSALALGCSGSEGGEQASDAASGTGGSSAGTTSGGGTAGTTSGKGGNAGAAGDPGGAAGTGPVTCQGLDVSRTPLRRLTRFEYANTVSDLLHVDPAPAADLPADEVTNGFDNNAGVLTVSALHAEKYVFVSEALAKTAVANLSALTTCDTQSLGEDECALDFARSFGRRAFRRPTTASDETALLAAYAAGRTGGSYAEGIEVMIRAALQSPDFLYRLELAPATDPNAALVPLDAFELATRLSYLVWASGPDDALLDAAAQGGLATKEAVAAKAREMLADPRSRVSIGSFFNQWTGVTRLPITTKDTARFPAFTDELRDAMARELPAFLDYVLTDGDHSLGTLLTAPVAFVSGPLASVYGVTAPGGSATTPVRVALPENQDRAGILTQAGFLSVQGHPDQTSPVLRGKFVRSMLLCDPPPPPPPDVNISIPEVDSGATARERFAGHRSSGTSCEGCHTLMDPIGLAFEHFDAMGQYRELDNGQAIDVSGEVMEATDPALAGPFTGVSELAAKLAESEQVRTCVATQWFRFASGRLEGPADTCSVEGLARAFSAAEGDLVELLVATTQMDSFWYRTKVTP
jgi:hypothetical protein